MVKFTPLITIGITCFNVEDLIQKAKQLNTEVLIEIDGGVGHQNALALIQAGADVLVAGNAVFGAQNPMEMISELKKIR